MEYGYYHNGFDNSKQTETPYTFIRHREKEGFSLVKKTISWWIGVTNQQAKMINST